MAEKPVAKKAGWKAPPRVYFGPKDPDTGERLEEDPYLHEEYPKWLYHPTAEPIMVASLDEHATLDKEWKEKPYGPMTHPSADDILKVKLEAAKAKAK